ncbi:MAG: response regulator [Candidatus Levybacteria bacterium]|nr:response regulator [Candidatus Levybacteria bacterium]
MNSILLVEDDLTLAIMYQDQLQLDGFDVSLAHDGEEGLQKAISKKPSLILLDIAMPKMDGMSMLTELRKDAWGQNVPVIILTIMDPNERMLQQVMELKPAYYLFKANSTPQDVSDKIKEVLSLSENPQPAS